VEVTDTTELRCGACAAPLAPDDRFCERCGARLEPADADQPGCRVCGADATAFDDDGYCTVCGTRQRDQNDRVELDLGAAAAVSDRGRVHRRNEDAFALEVVGPGQLAAAVCDGISSASASDAAARSAALAGIAVLERALRDPNADSDAAMLEATLAAHNAVAAVPWTTRADRGLPSCTLVAALCRDDEITVASVGDSRAYWADGHGVRQLTVDDSWAEEQVQEGRLSAEQALGDPRSHSITHWIGADAPPRPPRVVSLRPAGTGRLLLCSDGLWNYAPSPAAVGELLDALPDRASPAAVARALTDFAISRGGRDNITVVVADVDPASRSNP
jgi:serine/threonine protein phosphatase PrpC